MANGYVKSVYPHIVTASARLNYLIDRLKKGELDAAAKLGDSVDIPSLGGRYTVSDARDGDGNLQDVTAQAHGLTAATMLLDQFKFVNVQLPVDDEIRALDGTLAKSVGEKMSKDLRAEVDDELCAYLLGNASAASHANAAGASLTMAMFLTQVGELINAGASQDDLEFWVNPVAQAAFAGLITPMMEMGNASDKIGPKAVGMLWGVPVIMSPSIERNRTVAATASAIAANVLTCTVPSGHGLAVGQMITTSGGDANVTTAAAIVSVGDTSITVALAEADDAANGALTIRTATTPCLLVDKARAHAAIQLVPTVDRVKHPNRPAANMHLTTAYGRQAAEDACKVLHLAI